MHERINVFISYSHKDSYLREQLENHLSPLMLSGRINLWYDRAISAGSEWEKVIDTNIATSHLILLLISPDFISSKYCYGKEMTQALKRHNAGEAWVIPIILRPVILSGTPFEKLQALPTSAKPVISWDKPDEAFFDIAIRIQQVVEEIASKGFAKKPVSITVLDTTNSEVNGLIQYDDIDQKVSVADIVTSKLAERQLTVIPSGIDTKTFSDKEIPLSNPAIDVDTLYREGVNALRQENLTSTMLLWNEIISRYPDFQQGTFPPQMRKLLWRRANRAHRVGDWEKEITLCNSLLEVEIKKNQGRPSYEKDTRIQKLFQSRKRIAEQNLLYVKEYEKAQQDFDQDLLDEARNSLKQLWQDAPYYGDPAGLATKLNLHVPHKYEKKEKQEQRLQFIYDHPPNGLNTTFGIVLVSVFSLLIGLGSVIGLLTQSWVWAGGASLLIASLTFVLGYYRTMTLYMMIFISLLSAFIASIVALCLSPLSYNQPEVSYFSLTITGHIQFALWGNGSHTMWLGRQIDFGLILGMVVSILFYAFISSDDEVGWAHLGGVSGACLLLAYIAAISGWGFGFGFGWQFAILGSIAGSVGMPGLIHSIRMWFRTQDSFQEYINP